MAELTPIIHRQAQAKTTTLLKKHVTYEVSNANDADTVTVPEMTTIDDAYAVDLATGTEVTINIATNVVTINDVGVSGDTLLIVAVGA